MSLLVRDDLSWITEDDDNIAVYHLLSAVRPESLRSWLESDLHLSRYDLRKNSKGPMAHPVRLCWAFQLVDNGTSIQGKTFKSRNLPKDSGGSDRNSKTNIEKKGTYGENKLPASLSRPSKSKSFRRLLKDCAAIQENQKKVLFKRLETEKHVTGPSR